MNEYIIRQAILKDVEAVTRIWMEGSKKSLGFTIPDSDYERFFSKKISNQTDEFRMWIAEKKDGTILGWQSLFETRINPAINNLMAESSTYVSKHNTVKGIGKLLLNHALKYCSDSTNIRYVFGLVLNENTKSLKMCKEVGFVDMGVLPKKWNRDFPSWNFVVYET